MQDRDYIRADNLQLFCNSNEALLSGKPVGIVIEFPGLGGGSCLGGSMEFKPYDTDYAKRLGAEGILLLYTFPGPWSWMNRGAVKICELVLDAAIEKFGLDADVPVVSTGGSMGGLGAMIFAADSKHHIAAVAAACPGFDPEKMLFVFPDRPRAMLSAIASYDMPFEEALKTISPVRRLKELPDVPYFIVGDVEDERFAIEDTDEFVRKLSEEHTVTYRRLEKCRHGWFTRECRAELTEFVISGIKG